MEIVEFKEVEKSFRIKDIGGPRQKVLDSISFNVKKGEILGLVGLNGQGKSTTIKIMLGLLFPDKGKVRVFGSYTYDVKIKRRIAYLPENPVFFENLNAVEFLSFVGGLRGVNSKKNKDIIESLIFRVGLSGSEKKSIRKYSKGMVQRLGLAQAFIGNPEFVILDEPLSGLDPLGRKMAKELIIEHKNKGKTVFFTSHILEDIEDMCDRILILNRGKIIKEIEKNMLLNKRLEDVFVEALNNGEDAVSDA